MKICMLAYTFYESDNRVRRYAETLTRRGDSVDVIVLRQKDQALFEEINGAKIYRIQEREINERGKLTYLIRLIRFFIKSAILVGRMHFKESYDLIHVHSVPDFEVFASMIPKLKGAKIILDIHDLVPEFYGNKFNKAKSSFLYKCLIFIEKISIAFSDHVIISNHFWCKTLFSRSTNKNKCTVIMNYADNSIFYPRNSGKEKNKLIMMYPGTLIWHQGLDIAVNAFAIIKDQAPEVEFHIYGDGHFKNRLIDLIKNLGLERRVLLKNRCTLDQIADLMANADIGIIPKRNDSFGSEAFSTKSLEFMSSGVPVIISKTKIDQYYFDETIVKFFEPENKEDLARAMLHLIKDKRVRETLSKNALKFVAENNWESKKLLYLDLVDSLVG